MKRDPATQPLPHPGKSRAPRALRRAAAVLALLVAVLAAPAAAAPKTDVVVLKNGDHLTGEIKQLQRGLLTLKTDALGTVEIEWKEIASIRTKQLLEVVQTDGSLSYGRVGASAQPGSLVLTRESPGTARSTLPLGNIVGITPISEGAFWNRVDGHVSVGISAKAANDDREFSVAAGMDYRDTRRGWSVEYQGGRSESSNNPTFERHDLRGIHQRYFGETRFWGNIASLTTNDELDLNMRVLVGTGIGRFWLRNQSQELSTVVGLAVARESYRDETPEASVEAVLGASYDFFHFDDPDVDLSADLRLFPSLSVSGRLRSELGLTARFEIVDDLYYELGFTHSQDTKPPNETAEQVDWSLNSSLGYTF